MKLVFIYDNIDLKTVNETVGRLIDSVPLGNHNHVLTNEKLLYDIAVDVKTIIHENEDYIIFIDQYLTCLDKGFELLQHNAGIALIKFIRMLEVRNHIVLITPFAGMEIELVKQKPANLIVTSKGISFSKHLYEFSMKPIAELENLAQFKFDKKQDLKPYILADFRLPEDERHNWANWWGIDRLWHIHRVVEKDKYGNMQRWNLKEYPDSLKDKLKVLKNRQALYLYGHQDKIISTRLKEVNDEIIGVKNKYHNYSTAREDFIKQRDTIRFLINEKTFEIANIESNFTYIESRLLGLNGLESVFSQNKAECIRRITELSAEIRELQSSLTEEKGLNQRIREIDNRISDKETALDKLKKQFEEEGEKYIAILKIQINKLDSELKKLQSRVLSSSVSALRGNLQNLSPKILYIDDQASDGWSNIFQHIIYGKEDKNLFNDEIQPKQSDIINAEYFTKTVASKIVSHKPDLILLDLRLNKESGVRGEVEKPSGAVILKEIRKQHPGIPIMMTTASNKSWSYEELQRIGCDAFWTKEGVDTGMTEADSIKNYLRFAELVNVLTGDDYRCLKEYSEQVKLLEEKGKTIKHWWQQNNRFNKDMLEEIEPRIVYNILKDTANIFKEYLKNKIIKQAENAVWNEWFYASLIMQNLGKIVEKLHYGGAEVSAAIMQYREDYCGQQLFQKRHDASHIELTKKIKPDDANKYMKAILGYLNNRDYCPKPDITEINENNLQISREQLMKYVAEANRKKKR